MEGMKKSRIEWKGFLVLAIMLGVLGGSAKPLPAEAGLLDDLKNAITGKKSVIQQLDEEINQFRSAVTQTQAKKQTLQGELNQIISTDKSLAGQINNTENKISLTAREIDEINSEIRTKEEIIAGHQLALSESLRNLSDKDRVSLVEVLLGYERTTDLWNDLASLDKFRASVEGRVTELDLVKQTLAQKRAAEEAEKNKLATLKNKLADEKKIVAQNKANKDKLLTATKNQEAEYQKLLADRLEKKRLVEEEIRKLEAEINLTVNPSALPSTGKGVLAWPLDKIVITQYFGNTAFATANAQVYNGNGHNGVDFGIPTGTAVKAALSGTVLGAGDTDTACQGASYGKWVLIQHGNGLTTLYAHLSLIKVSSGQTVTTGEIIGYSGNTGYSTGPHLHFTVFASDGVKVGTLQSKVPGCGVYTLPLGAKESYLNPLSYL